MYCKHCGRKLDEDARFCPACGKTVEKDAAEEPVYTPEEPVYVDEEPTAAPKAKSPVLPAILMGVFLLVWNFITVLLNLNLRTLTTLIQQGLDRGLRNFFISFSVNAGLVCVQAFIGAVIVLVVILIRRKKLASVTYKDLIAFAVFVVSVYVFNRLGGLITANAMNRYGGSIVAAKAASTSALSIAGFSTLLGWVGLAIFLLARSGAKIVSLIAGICVVVFYFIVGVCLAVFAAPVMRLFTTHSSVIEDAIIFLRIGAIVMVLPVFVQLLFYWGWGSEKIGFIPAVIYGPVQGFLNLVLGSALTYLLTGVIKTGLAYVEAASVLPWLAGGVYLILFTVLGAVKAAKKKKALNA
ncbi:MAG: zinc-ribbon domain-containing protein [Clostridia bacterium]|nr:zinc-ribbon domain-containing protein [Clostridia bacterium]